MSDDWRQRMTQIDPRAVIHDGAELGDGVVVEPFAIVGPRVKIGDRTRVSSSALVAGDTEIGDDCLVGHGAVVGTDPQDLKYDGETTYLRIGDRTTIREYANINRATGEGEATIIGDDCFIMGYVHIAHNCVLGNQVILANSVVLAGHVELEDFSNIGGMTPVHQFVRVGTHCHVGGFSRVTHDIPPYFRAAGYPAKPFDVNYIGLTRRGFPEDALSRIREMFRILYRSDLNTAQAIERIREELPMTAEVDGVLSFIDRSTRGIAK